MPVDVIARARESSDGVEHTNGFRAVFCQQYRLFFRLSSDDKAIIVVWVSDGRSRRAYGSNSNADRVFQRMLASGHPPDSWDNLLSQAAPNTRRLRRVAPPDDPDA